MKVCKSISVQVDRDKDRELSKKNGQIVKSRGAWSPFLGMEWHRYLFQPVMTASPSGFWLCACPSSEVPGFRSQSFVIRGEFVTWQYTRLSPDVKAMGGVGADVGLVQLRIRVVFSDQRRW